MSLAVKPKRKARARSSPGLILRLAVTAGLLGFLALKIEWRELGRLLLQADGWLLASVACLAPLTVLGLAWRLQYLLRKATGGGLRLPFAATWRVTWGGQFFNSCLPGATGGDVYKIYELCRLFPQAGAAGAAAVVADRFFALLALVGLAGVSLAVVPLPWGRLLGGGGSGGGGLIVPAGIVWGIMVGSILLAAGGVTAARSPECRTRIVRLLTGTAQAVRQALRYFQGGSITWIGLGLAVVVHSFNFWLVFLLTRALGIGLAFFQVVALMPVLLLAVLLPVTINGHGLREVLMIGAFTWLQVGVGTGVGDSAIGPRECAVALSLIMVACDLVCALPGGVLFFLHRRNRGATAQKGGDAGNHF
ncbi:putative integral membrane protein [Opitutaceae bacterium TAV1]|nr:putative integral membrane protein [Opitutaceae bacterium TAV1]